MSDLLLMSSLGLPRTGLVALYDPYRDAYGRNVSTSGVASLYKYMVTLSGSTFYESADTDVHAVKPVQTSIAGVVYTAEFRFAPVGGRKRFMLVIGGPDAVFDVTTCTLIASSGFTGTPEIESLGDGQFAIRGTATASGTGGVYIATMPDDADAYADRAFAGDTSKGFTFNRWQVNLGSVLRDYSAPAGAPGTLQTGTDYSGRGNTVTLGGSTDVGTDDPYWKSTGWYFGGDDYATAGRPAQLEVAQPFCGYVVAKAGADGSIMTLLGKANALTANASSTGFWLFRHSSSNYLGLRFVGPSAYNINTSGTFAFTVASGYQGIFFGWDGTSLILRTGSVAPTPVSGAWVPNTTQNLTIGKNAAADEYFWTGDIAYVSMWAGVCWPTAVSTRIHNYAKSLFAGRGVTVA